MLTHTLEKNHTPSPPDWSRDEAGAIHMDAFSAFVLFGRIFAWEPTAVRWAEREGIISEEGMEFEAWVEKNGIVLPWMVES